MSTSTTVLAAVFADRESAVAAREALGHEHYHFRWLATTKPAEHDAGDASVVAEEPHDIVEGSDGPIGAIGRFLSGAGASLHKALRDHGVTEEDAEAIDAATPAHGAVLVVHAPADRVADASALMTRGGGRLFSGDDVALTNAPGSLTPAEADREGLIPDYDKSASVAVVDPLGLGPAAAIESSSPAPDAAGVTNAIGRRESPIDVPIDREELFVERRSRPGVATEPPSTR